MSVTATRSYQRWLEFSPEAEHLSPTARLIGWLLCDMVNHAAVEAEEPWYVWPSREKLARIAGIGVRQVSRSTGGLEDVGVIADTGIRVGHGIVAWQVMSWKLEEVVTPDMGVPGSGVTPDTSVPGSKGATRDTEVPAVGHQSPRGVTPVSQGGDSSVPAGGHGSPTEPEENQKVEPEENQKETESVSPSADPDVSSNISNNGTDSNNGHDSPDLPADSLPATEQRQVGTEEWGALPRAGREEVAERERMENLATLEAQLQHKPNHGPTQRAVEALRSELGLGPPDNDPVPTLEEVEAS